MAHIAIEGRCFVLSACQFSRESDYPADHPVYDASNRSPDNVMIAGGSVMISPLGKVLAGPLLDGEGVLTAELDLDDMVRGKFDLDVVGHYARNDGEWGFPLFGPRLLTGHRFVKCSALKLLASSKGEQIRHFTGAE